MGASRAQGRQKKCFADTVVYTTCAGQFWAWDPCPFLHVGPKLETGAFALLAGDLEEKRA